MGGKPITLIDPVCLVVCALVALTPVAASGSPARRLSAIHRVHRVHHRPHRGPHPHVARPRVARPRVARPEFAPGYGSGYDPTPTCRDADGTPYDPDIIGGPNHVGDGGPAVNFGGDDPCGY